MKRTMALALAVATATALALVGATSTAGADTATTGFESFSTGNPNGQFGWQFTGPYDVAIVDPTAYSAPSAFGTRAFRISNAVTSGSFGDWAFSASLADDAGEPLADGGVFTGGTRQSRFDASFDITSAVPDAEQPGLQFSLAPDRGDGARMSFLRFRDLPDGIEVSFADYVDAHPQGSPGNIAAGCGAEDDFRDVVIASGLSRNEAHTIRIAMEFLEGPANDRVFVWVDGALEHVGTSWEDYFRYCEGNPTRPVDSLIFQARSGGGTAPDTLGKGFLIDNLTLESGETPVIDTVGDWELYPPQSVETTDETTSETVYQTHVLPPINANGGSNWPKKRGVIPIQFDLSSATQTTTTTTTTTGPVVFESIGSDEDTANDYSYLSFEPTTPPIFGELQELLSQYAFSAGDCGGGSLRWSVGVDVNGDGVIGGSTEHVFIYYGDLPNFTDCTTNSQAGVNMIGQSDARYDSSQILPGTQYNTYAGVLGLVGDAPVLGASLVLDSGWLLDQVVDLTGASANGNDWVPLPEGTATGEPVVTTGDFTPTCDLPQAQIVWTRSDPLPTGTINETAESIQNRDTGDDYRIVDCKYIYNLDVSSLGDLDSRAGTYYVYVKIDGEVVTEFPATFDLK